jgi:hypothetical protein
VVLSIRISLFQLAKEGFVTAWCTSVKVPKVGNNAPAVGVSALIASAAIGIYLS